MANLACSRGAAGLGLARFRATLAHAPYGFRMKLATGGRQRDQEACEAIVRYYDPHPDEPGGALMITEDLLVLLHDVMHRERGD